MHNKRKFFLTACLIASFIALSACKTDKKDNAGEITSKKPEDNLEDKPVNKNDKVAMNDSFKEEEVDSGFNSLAPQKDNSGSQDNKSHNNKSHDSKLHDHTSHNSKLHDHTFHKSEPSQKQEEQNSFYEQRPNGQAGETTAMINDNFSILSSGPISDLHPQEAVLAKKARYV